MPTAAVLAAVTLTLAACSGGGNAAADEGTGISSDERPVVLTTFAVLADIARNVAGDHLRVESITNVGAQIHGDEPTPGDVRRAAEANLILDNGLNLEAWFAQFVADLDVPHPRPPCPAGPVRRGRPAQQEGSRHGDPHEVLRPENLALAFGLDVTKAR